MKGAVFLSIIDQALLSAFNLALNLAFIAWSTPGEFGRFVLVLSGAFFAISAQNALIIMPLNYLLPGREAEEADAKLSMLTSANLALTAGATLASLTLGLLIGADMATHAAIAAYFAATLLREYTRGIMVVKGRVDRTLINDALFVAASAGLILALWPLGEPVTMMLSGIAGGGLIALLLGRVDMQFAPARFIAHLKAYRAVWKETRWALQGALQHEVEARGYVFLVEHWRDAATLGMLQAGRVTLSPLLLINNAWRRVARPRIVEDMHRGRPGNIARTLWFGAAVIAGATLLYGAVLAAAWPLLELYVFKQRYGDMTGIVLSWWLYSCIVGMLAVPVTLLEARRQFRLLATVGFAGATLIVMTLSGLAFVDFDVKTVVLTLCAVHAIELIVYLAMIRRPVPAHGEEAAP